jgi:hypothetical protein
MSEQLTIDDLSEGERLRDEAFTGLDEADRGDWEKNVIMRAIREVASQGRPFSANHVRDLLPAVNTNRIGRCFAQAAKDGLIEWVTMERSTDPKTHGHRINVWRAAS